MSDVQETNGGPPSEEGVVVAALGVEIPRAKDYTQVYSNLCRLTFAYGEAQLTFAVAAIDSRQTPVLEDKTTVFMGVQAAKSMTVGLTKMVEQYEAVWGVIPLPDQLISDL